MLMVEKQLRKPRVEEAAVTISPFLLQQQQHNGCFTRADVSLGIHRGPRQLWSKQQEAGWLQCQWPGFGETLTFILSRLRCEPNSFFVTRFLNVDAKALIISIAIYIIGIPGYYVSSQEILLVSLADPFAMSTDDVGLIVHKSPKAGLHAMMYVLLF